MFETLSRSMHSRVWVVKAAQCHMSLARHPVSRVVNCSFKAQAGASPRWRHCSMAIHVSTAHDHTLLP